jgi:hypothetical protein
MQVLQVLVQMLGVRLRRDLVPAWGTALLGLARGFQQEIPIKQVNHVVAHHLRIALGLLCNSLELHGDRW